MADMGVMGQMVCDAGNSGTQFTPVTLPCPGLDGGFAPLDALLRRVVALMVQFPPRGGPSGGFSRLGGPRRGFGGPR